MTHTSKSKGWSSAKSTNFIRATLRVPAISSLASWPIKQTIRCSSVSGKGWKHNWAKAPLILASSTFCNSSLSAWFVISSKTKAAPYLKRSRCSKSPWYTATSFSTYSKGRSCSSLISSSLCSSTLWWTSWSPPSRSKLLTPYPRHRTSTSKLFQVSWGKWYKTDKQIQLERCFFIPTVTGR